MTLSLSDVTSFFQKLEKQPASVNQDGILNQTEAEQAYNQMLLNKPCDIPDDIKKKFANGGLNSDAFNQIDPLGMKDGFINDQELYKFVSGDSSFKPYTPPAGSGTVPSFADAGYLVQSNGESDERASAQSLIKDVGGILGSANDGGVADKKLSKAEVDHAITLIQANTSTVDHAGAKASLLSSISKNFDSESVNGYITSGSLSKALLTNSSISSDNWS